jgi:hypothetical protein
MKKNEILLRVVENLLDENKRLRAEISQLKQREMNPRTSEFFESLVNPKIKVKVEPRSQIVNDPTDMIQEYHDLIDEFEKERLKDNEKHNFPKAGFVAGGEKVVPSPKPTLEKTLKIFSELRELQREIEEYQKSKKESKS